MTLMPHMLVLIKPPGVHTLDDRLLDIATPIKHQHQRAFQLVLMQHGRLKQEQRCGGVLWLY